MADNSKWWPATLTGHQDYSWRNIYTVFSKKKKKNYISFFFKPILKNFFGSNLKETRGPTAEWVTTVSTVSTNSG
jgi:hypothetical protein